MTPDSNGHNCGAQPLSGLSGALGGPLTAYQYDWNMLPIGQQLWLKELESYETYPPLQAPQILQSQWDPGGGQEGQC